MLIHFRPALVLTLLFTLLLGLAYPLAITGIGQLAFPYQAGGSLVVRDGRTVGSALIGQNFASPGYFHPRPSAAGADGYDASASSGSNYGPLNPDLAARVAKDAAALKAQGIGSIPADAVTASASGLDPQISPAYAAAQVPRIATARNLPAGKVEAIIDLATTRPALGFLGQPAVNVLQANLALDAAVPRAQP